MSAVAVNMLKSREQRQQKPMQLLPRIINHNINTNYNDNMDTTTSGYKYFQILDLLKEARIIWFGLCFGIDVYDTYLHKYPSPDPIDVELRERGAFAKYESVYGRLCWMGLSCGAYALLLKKNIGKAQNKQALNKFEIGCIAGIIGGWILRIWCKYLMGERYTYSIVVYKDHRILTNGPYAYIRHPGMFGMLLNLGCTYSWLNHWWGWAVYALCVRDTYVS
eukprot:UN04168